MFGEDPVSRALQCCLVCGRTYTERALHEALETAVIASIREAHPEWVDERGGCGPCVGRYRKLLRDRLTREERVRASTRRRWPRWLATVLGRPPAPDEHREV